MCGQSGRLLRAGCCLKVMQISRQSLAKQYTGDDRMRWQSAKF